MKKLIVLAMVALMGVSAANAQLLRSRTFTKAEGPKTMWIVRAGVSFDNIGGKAVSESKKIWENEDLDAGFGSKAGYDFSIAFNKPIANSGAFWGMELGFGTRGYTVHEKDTWDEGQYEDYNGNLLTHTVRFMPIMFGYRYSINDKIAIDAHLGFYASYDMAGTYKTKTEKFTSYHGLENDEDSYSLSESDWRRYDAGMQLGAGFWFGRFNLDLSWQRGFIGVFDDSGDNATSSNLMLRLGVGF